MVNFCHVPSDIKKVEGNNEYVNEISIPLSMIRLILVGTILFPLPSLFPGAACGDEISDAIRHAKSLSRAFRAAADTTSPAVVTVISKMTPGDEEGLSLEKLPFDLPPGFRVPDGFRLPLNLESRSVGSGVIIDASGIILTNGHVVHGADEVVIRLIDGSEVEATEIQADMRSDLAIIRIKSSARLQVARLGDSDKLEIGDWVIAIGSPFELDTTVSAGIISGKGREVSAIRRGKLIQTDAAINPGNSGGPLVNLDGEVVGISTAIASNSGGYQGIGFAIPSNRAKWVVQQLIRWGKVKRAYLGIKIDSVDAEFARKNKLESSVTQGVLVNKVEPDTPAAKAGIEDRDIIVAFGDIKVRDARDLQDAVEQLPFDSKHTVTIMRAGRLMTVDVVLEPMPDNFGQRQRTAPQSENKNGSP